MNSRLLSLTFVVVLAAGAARAEYTRYGPPELDWSTWRRLPVFYNGRVMPLDTFARETVEAVCGSPRPTLAPPAEQAANLKGLFPDGRPRTFSAAEVLFSWLAEPEQWGRVPMLVAGDRQLREVLGLPVVDAKGRRLRYASLDEVEDNTALSERWEKTRARATEAGKRFHLTGVDKKIERLVDARTTYRQLTFDPKSADAWRQRFVNRVALAIEAWRRLASALQQGDYLEKDEEVRRLMVRAGEALQQLATVAHSDEFTVEEMETPVVAFRHAAEPLADRLADNSDRVLAAMAADLRRQTIEAHLAMFDNGDALRLVPALEPAALEENRTPNDDAQPWLAVQVLLYGSEDLLRDYPPQELQAVRTAFATAKEAYLDRAAVDRPARFATAMNRFAAALRAFGNRVEPLRRKLPILHRDQELIDATAYPPRGSTDLEVIYNRVDPFFWSWSISLAAVTCFACSWGAARKPMSWLGAAALLVAQGFIIMGLAVRMAVTGLVPLTGMFETVVWVALCVALLSLWFVLWPLIRFVARRCVVGLLPSLASPLGGFGAAMEEVLGRRFFVLGGAAMCCLAVLLACYAPATVMKRHIGAVAPILRDNYWLVVHVVTIMASYAAAAIGLILGNVALGHYLFGRYRNPPPLPADSAMHRLGRRPPEACATLASFTYTAVRMTVLLLAAGTILGAMWADKAWGHFWAWDPKEVWALISLLVYLFVLHARPAGWSSDFSMAVGAVLGATAVLFTWYGVNFVLGSGMHAYGAGSGGQWHVAAAVGLNWLFLAAATVRYLVETCGGESSTKGTKGTKKD